MCNRVFVYGELLRANTYIRLVSITNEQRGGGEAGSAVIADLSIDITGDSNMLLYM